MGIWLMAAFVAIGANLTVPAQTVRATIGVDEPVPPCPTPGQHPPIEEQPCYRNEPSVVSLTAAVQHVNTGGFLITVTFHWVLPDCAGATFPAYACIRGAGTEVAYNTCPDGVAVPCASITLTLPFDGCGYTSSEIRIAWWDPGRTPGNIMPNVHEDIGYPYDLGPCPGDPPRPPPPSPELIVNSTGDTVDANTGDAKCDSDLGTADNQCTLRAAIEESNARQAGGSGSQTITFAVPGGGLPTISPQTALPEVKGKVTVDGTTQAGGWVELNGSGASGLSNGLNLTGGGSTVKGMVINLFKAAGIRAAGAGGHVITGNRIGTNAAGTAALPNVLAQVLVDGGSKTRIGGPTGTTPGGACSGDCNVVAIGSIGIKIASATETLISGNHIGVTAAGSAVLAARHGSGILVSVAGDLTKIGRDLGVISEPAANYRNVISGATSGIAVDGTGRVSIQGNFIGTDTSGMHGLGNDFGVKVLSGLDTQVGDSTDIPGQDSGNVISGNGGSSAGAGVSCEASCTVFGNLIGLGADGSTAIPNRIGIEFGDCGQVGTTAANTGNVISGNTAAGIDATCTTYSHLSKFVFNRVGVARDGMTVVPNGGPGIVARGIAQIDDNLVAGNLGDGIQLMDETVAGVTHFVDATVRRNTIGLLPDRATPAGNAGHGMVATTSASTADERAQVHLRIESNQIAANTKAGIKLAGPTAALGLLEQPVRKPSSGADPLATIAFNVIGVDRNSQARPNQWGIEIVGLANVRINGNDIAGNVLGGIHLATAYADVIDNYIGQVSGRFLSQTGVAGPVANDGPGIKVEGDDNVIGLGPLAEVDPTGSFTFGAVSNHFGPNTGSAVLIAPSLVSQGVGNTVRDNSFAITNSVTPIDLSTTETGDGRTPNPPDPSTGTRPGPNDLLPHPNINSLGARRIDGALSVHGSLGGLQSWGSIVGKYAIDLYSANGCPAVGEYTPIGFTTTSTLFNGAFEFASTSVSASVTAVAVTATAPQKLIAFSADTSEISACEPVVPGSAINASAHAGDTELNVNSPGTFKVGDSVTVDPDGAHPETATVAGHGSIILDHPLEFDHPAGAIVIIGGAPGTSADSPYALKQAASAELHSMLPTGYAPGDSLLRKAIARIDGSLARWRWIGEDALSPLHGYRVFNAERKAVRLLSSPLFAGGAKVNDAIWKLVTADRAIVVKAIGANTNASEVAKANTRLARADAFIAAGDYAKAIRSFQWAWRAAVA